MKRAYPSALLVAALTVAVAPVASAADEPADGLVDPRDPLANDSCNCRTDAPQPAPVAGLLGLLVLLGLRRRS